ncbi:MAG: helix-hairpin-helix domain-containing protein [Eubacterium sp.]|nr:helix-hairpin-helix domain-containing protein [Eubacterium sp.]
MFVISHNRIQWWTSGRSICVVRCAWICFVLLLAVFPIFLSGCGKDEGIYQFSSVSSASVDSLASVTVSSDETVTEAAPAAGSDPGVSGEAGSPAPDTSVGDASGADAAHASASEDTICYVYVCGAVRNPGVYALPLGSRVYEAIAMAGGVNEEADERSLNQASVITDGQQITVYTREEIERQRESGGVLPGQESAEASGDASSAAAPVKSRVNINTATKEELMTLTGIGETRANAIIAYREEHGAFSRIEDIMQIEGIKEKSFAKIRDSIEV